MFDLFLELFGWAEATDVLEEDSPPIEDKETTIWQAED